MSIPEIVITEAVEAIITARNFCGNEREAVWNVALDHAMLAEFPKIRRIANFRANARWNSFKKAAGVKAKHTW